ncbi:MAG: hypothetical protein LBV78_14405 [Kitasatospora sp.]|nr:hypothetical protein [Kitasatospora sp.]
MTAPAGCVVAARGATGPDGPVRARTVRTGAMDPACWAVLDAVGAALEELAGGAGPAVADGSRVGVIVVSEEATAQTLHRLVAETASGGFSPRQFVAASPGTVVGTSCSAYGLGGPSLLLTMPPGRGRPVAAELARQWLGGRRPRASAVALVLCRQAPEGHHLAECLWLVPAPPPSPQSTQDPDRSVHGEERP